MKIEVIKKMEDAVNGYFRVMLNDELEKNFSFDITAPKGDLYNEDVNRQKAIKYAKELENPLPEPELIYTNQP